MDKTTKYILSIFIICMVLMFCYFYLKTNDNNIKETIVIEKIEQKKVESNEEFIKKLLEQDSLTINKDKINITNLLSNEFKNKFFEMKEITKKISYNLNQTTYLKETKDGKVKVTFTSICQTGIVIPERIKTYMIVTVDNKTNLISLYEHRGNFYLDTKGLMFLDNKDVVDHKYYQNHNIKEEFLINENNLNKYNDSLLKLLNEYLEIENNKLKAKENEEIKRKTDALKALKN